ncbi:MAG: hypothetical protein NDI60_03855 [Elusimicrobiales bacterium]|nr:hypothetical protein [Elusimicrobiales bacterium]
MSHRKKTPPPGKRTQVLMLAPSVPSPRLSRSEKTSYAALTLAAAAHDVLCLPQDRPLSARLDEAAVAAGGVNVYAFPGTTPGEISEKIKTLITANPGLKVIGFIGLAALRRHLVDARLFAPGKAFFAVLDRADMEALAAAGKAVVPGGERDLLAGCDAVLCETAADARFLRGFFGAKAGRLAGIAKTISELSALGAHGPVPLALCGAPGCRPRSFGRAFRPLKVVSAGRAFDPAAINGRLLAPAGDAQAWAVIARPFTACSALWERLAAAFLAFPNAGMVLPFPAFTKENSAAGAMALEALSLSRQGRHSEPVIIEDLPLVLVRPEAFKRAGGLDTRFTSPACSWTDLALRMRQGGFRAVTAEDAVLASRAPAPPLSRHDADLLTHKWCADGMRIMELLVSELGVRQP